MMAKLERESRHWPLVYADTVIYVMSQDLLPLPQVIRRDSMSEQDFEECKKVSILSSPPSLPPRLSLSLSQVIKSLQSKEMAGEALSVPSAGTRAKGVKR